MHALLTARHFAEVNELRVRLGVVARSEVGVLVALVQPRVKVSAQTTWCDGARFHAVFQ